MKLHCIPLALLVSAFMIFFSPHPIFAQDNASDSSFFDKALINTMAVYHQSFNEQSALYNGGKYGEYQFRFNEGQPFYNSVLPGTGYVIYDGIRYDDVLMRYDEVADVLVINADAERIQLLSKRVSYFHLYNADFIRLEKDSSTEALISTGFYNLLHKGNVSLLRKQVKTIREVISSSNELQHMVDTKDFYYFETGDKIYPIKRKNDLYRLLGDHRKEVQQFVKQNGLNFRTDRQNMLVQATAYYDALKK